MHCRPTFCPGHVPIQKTEKQLKVTRMLRSVSLRYWGAPVKLTAMIFGIARDLADVIIPADFCMDLFNSFGFTRVKVGISIGLAVAYSAIPRSY